MQDNTVHPSPVTLDRATDLPLTQANGSPVASDAPSSDDDVVDVLNGLLENAGAQRNHDQIRDLRNAARERS